MSCEGCEEGAYVIDALAKLLAEIAIIVNGPEPPLTRWSYHDLPEKVRALKQAPPAALAVPADPVAWQYRFATPDGLTWSDWQQISSEAMAREMVEAFGKAGTRAEWRSLKVFEWGGYAGECTDEDFADERAQQPAAAVPEDAIEAAYWDFDARHKGYGPHKTTPQSERDAFKWAVRAMLAAAERAKGAES